MLWGIGASFRNLFAGTSPVGSSVKAPPPQSSTREARAAASSSDTFVSATAKGTYAGAKIGGRHLEVEINLSPGAANRLRAIDNTRGRIKSGQPAGVSILRIDGPHNRAPSPHINVQNMPPALKPLERFNHLRIPHIPDGALRAVRHAGKPLIVVGIAADVADFRRSRQADLTRGDGLNTEAKRSVGRIAGGWGGAAAGAALGATIGSVVPGLGTAIGGLVGGVVGGIGGSVGGSKLGEWAASRWF